ncbi:MAG: hemolysin family protein [Clostridia bacterium]|nr:hemolysin family protein [Clostridia bacterium]
MLVQVIVLFILIFINAIFASSEIAFLSINKAKLRKELKLNNKKAIKLKMLLDSPSGFLATIQIGITFAGFLASAFASESFSDIIVKNLSFFDISENILKSIVVILVTIILSYFTLVFGELVPKRISMAFPEKVAFLVVDFIYLLKKLTYPFVYILMQSTNFMTKILGVNSKKENRLNLEDIKLIISDGKDVGIIEDAEMDLIFNVFEFNDKEIYQIMTPKEEVFSISIDIDSKDLSEVMRKNKFTRIPIYSGEKENIIGILNVKDVIHFYTKSNEKFSLRELIRSPYFVCETEKIDGVFRDMQYKRQNMGIVRNGNNEFVGILTIEDMIEEIVGNIFDEYDQN